MREVSQFLLFALLLSCGCVGNHFRPGFSMTDPQYFSELPYIIAKPEGYSLRWRYGLRSFYFYPRSKVVGGQLLFALQATTSTGSPGGRYVELPITGSKRILALESGGAFWLEPGGRKVKLEVRR